MASRFTDQQHADALALAKQLVKKPKLGSKEGSGRVYAGGTPNFDERTGTRTGGIKPMRPPSKGGIKSPPIIPGLPSGPLTPGQGGVSPGQLPLGSQDPLAGTGGVKPPRQDPRLEPIKQPPISLPPVISDPLPAPSTEFAPPPSMGGSDDLFGAPGAGTYDSLMSRAFQEYSSGASPYAGAADFLMNRSVFDRGERPESSMPSAGTTPSYGYSDPGGTSGMAQMQSQQPALQAQYDQFAADIQSAQEAAQKAAEQAALQQQEQTDLATSERQALMDRIAALEGREGPDLDAFGQQLRQDILGEVDIDALRREITGEVLQIAQAEFPDVMQIRDEIMSLLPEQEQIDVENLRRQIQEAIDTGAPEEQVAALRAELQNRIRPVEEQLAGLQDERGDIAQQIGELRGTVGALPDIDVEQLRQSIISQLPEQERVDIEALQRRIQESIDAGAPEEEIAGLRLELEQRLAPVEERVTTVRDQLANFRENFDPAALREQIGNLRGRLEGINPATGANLDFGEIARRVQEQLPQDRGVVPPDVLERIRAVEQREGPDLSGIAGQIAALENRGLPPEVLERLRAVEQREGPDEAAIAERVRSGIDPRIADLRERLGRATQERSTLEERMRGRLEEVRGQVNPLSERIAQLRGRLDERPRIDENALIERIRGGIQVPQVDLSGIREQIANLRGKIDARPPGTGGVKPSPTPPKTPPRMGTFPPGYRGPRGGRG